MAAAGVKGAVQVVPVFNVLHPGAGCIADPRQPFIVNHCAVHDNNAGVQLGSIIFVYLNIHTLNGLAGGTRVSACGCVRTFYIRVIICFAFIPGAVVKIVWFPWCLNPETVHFCNNGSLFKWNPVVRAVHHVA